MFAAGAAAEVVPRQQNGAALIAGLVQHEIRVQGALAVVGVRLAFVQITVLVEQVHAETAAFDGFQELLGDDEIGVHIGPIQRHHDAFMSLELFHCPQPAIFRTSTKRP